jgi:Flp pilus assembly pilin Flp
MLLRRHPAGFSPALRRLAADESGQDLVEYALITSFIGVAGYLILLGLGVDIFNTYDSWLDPGTGVPSLWDPPAPSGGS